MRRSSALVLGLGLLLALSACGRRSAPAQVVPRRVDDAPPVAAPSASGGGVGSEMDAAKKGSFGTYEVIDDEAYAGVGQHGIKTILREKTPEVQQEFERLINKGSIRVLKKGTRMIRISEGTIDHMADKKEYRMIRIELVDDPSVHALVLESALKRID